jgi:hypothetical protein
MTIGKGMPSIQSKPPRSMIFSLFFKSGDQQAGHDMVPAGMRTVMRALMPESQI